MNIKKLRKMLTNKINIGLVVCLMVMGFSASQLLGQVSNEVPIRLELYNKSFEIFTRITGTDGVTSPTPVVSQSQVRDWHTFRENGDIGFIRSGHVYNAHGANRKYTAHAGDWMVRLNPIDTDGGDDRIEDVVYQYVSTNTLMMPILSSEPGTLKTYGIRLSDTTPPLPEVNGRPGNVGTHEITSLYLWNVYHTGEDSTDSMAVLIGDRTKLGNALHNAQVQYESLIAADPSLRANPTLLTDRNLLQPVLDQFAQRPFEIIRGIRDVNDIYGDRAAHVPGVNLSTPGHELNYLLTSEAMPNDGSGIKWNRFYGYMNPSSRETMFALMSYSVGGYQQGNIVDSANWYQIASPASLSFFEGDPRLDAIRTEVAAGNLSSLYTYFVRTSQISGRSYTIEVENMDDLPTSTTPGNDDYAYIVPVIIRNYTGEIAGRINVQIKVFTGTLETRHNDIITISSYICEVGNSRPIFTNTMYRLEALDNQTYSRPLFYVGQGVISTHVGAAEESTNFMFERMGTAADLVNCGIPNALGRASAAPGASIPINANNLINDEIILVYMVVPRRTAFMVSGQVVGLPHNILNDTRNKVRVTVDYPGVGEDDNLYALTTLPMTENLVWQTRQAWPEGSHVKIQAPQIDGFTVANGKYDIIITSLEQDEIYNIFTYVELKSVTGTLNGLLEGDICNMLNPRVEYQINGKHTGSYVAVNPDCTYRIDGIQKGSRIEIIPPTITGFVVRGSFSRIIETLNANTVVDFTFDYQPDGAGGGELDVNTIGGDPDEGLDLPDYDEEEDDDKAPGGSGHSGTSPRLPAAGSDELNQLLLALSSVVFLYLLKLKIKNREA